ncbi:MAG: helix-turn-helix domain-containing protein [Planctomycetota bacterium]|jgi:hypothetical protein
MIAKGANVNRHTVRKIYNNEATTVSLETVGRICEWLEEKGLCEGLPGALFAARPSKLFGAMVEPGLITFYLGEYRSTGFPKFRVARDDAAAAAMLVHSLSRRSHNRKLLFSHVHVPSHIPADQEEVKASSFKTDKIAAEAVFRRMRKDRAGGTSVLVGSARANYLVESFVSDLFGCRAFEASGGEVPFYLRYHEKARVPSCFGGNEPPTKRGADEPPGIYYRQGRKWLALRSEPRRRGAGVVIVRRDPGFGRLEVAVFGVSAISTAAMAKFICDTPDRFWPSGRVQAGLEVGIYLCKFLLGGMKTGEEGIDTTEVGLPDVVELDVDLPGKRRRQAPHDQRRAGR